MKKLSIVMMAIGMAATGFAIDWIMDEVMWIHEVFYALPDALYTFTICLMLAAVAYAFEGLSMMLWNRINSALAERDIRTIRKETRKQHPAFK